MAENIVVRGNRDVMAFEDLAGAFDNVQQVLPSTNTDPYLRMSKQGNWIYGAEDWKVEPGSKWAVSPLTMQIGYVCWSRYDDTKRKDEKLGEVMVAANAPMPNKASLPDFGFPWAEQVSFLVACVSGEDAGTQTKYATTSVGGMNEVKERLAKAISFQIKAEQARGATRETAKIVPIVELGSSSYKHPKYNEIFTPVFKIVAWATLNDHELPEDEEKIEATKPARRPAVKAVEPDATAPAAEAPRRRQRPAA